MRTIKIAKDAAMFYAELLRQDVPMNVATELTVAYIASGKIHV